MGKISRNLALMVIIGTAIVGFWVYQKYIRDTGPAELRVTVGRGDMEEVLRARGEVVPEREYNLEFASGGIVAKVYVAEGEEVAAGEALMELDTSELRLEEERLVSLVAQRTADRAKLALTASPADVVVYEVKVLSAATALHEAEKAEVLALRAVSSAMDDAVHGTTDLFYSNPGSTGPKLSVNTSDSQLASSMETERAQLGSVLDRAALAAAVSPDGDLHAAAAQMQADAQRIGVFLDDNAKLLNVAVTAGTVSASSIETWKSAVAAARVTLNTKASALAAAEEGRTSAEAAHSVAEKELASRNSPARAEDIAAADAALKEAGGQVNIVREKIRKAVLRAPEKSRVIKIAFKAGEAFRSGTSAATLHSLTSKVRTEISELDIVRVRMRDGQMARMSFDALPGYSYTGTVSSIEPQKIEKDGDAYYRVNLTLEGASADIRPGMSAEVYIIVSQKDGVLRLPGYATFDRDGTVYARVERNGIVEEVKVGLGISDGEYSEVITGLSEGDTVIVPSD